MQRVAVIGAGTMGRTHASIYASLPNAEVVAICDLRLEAAQEIAETHSARAFANLEEALNEVEIDLVDICTPTPTHLDHIKTAAAAGKNISCEKPLARTISQAMEVQRICEEAGVTLFAAHVVRWFPEYRRLKAIIDSGAIGETVMVRTMRGGMLHGGVGNWFTNLQMSGGAVLDLIIHDFDWLRWCYGRIRRVYAKGLYAAQIPGKDHTLVTLRFDSGVIAHIEGNWARPDKFCTSVEVAGTEGLLSFSSTDSMPLVIKHRSSDGTTSTTSVPDFVATRTPYHLELEHYINCLEQGITPDVTAEDGVEAIRICEAALKSISTGEPITLV
ncbi:MAG: Gfo/Idh/MocA family oxidoreductase [Armatimonadetes bacterium]|jgi:predicted dehydrogenase|nr:Gfo/Idh/MocA family oxidoreductase [Armatimonadota bacterium]